MKTDPLIRRKRKANVNRDPAVSPQIEEGQSPALIAVARSGDWMPADELREAALAALQEGGDVTFNLAGLDHLDASALQILLAFAEEQTKQGRQMHLLKASPALGKWFEFAGTSTLFARWGDSKQ